MRSISRKVMNLVRCLEKKSKKTKVTNKRKVRIKKRKKSNQKKFITCQNRHF